MLNIIKTYIFILLINTCSYANNINYEINNRLEALLKQADNYEHQSDFDNAIAIYNEALKIASENNLITDTCYIYKKIGLIYYTQKQYKNAKIYFRRSVLKDSNSKNTADSYFNLCLIYRKEKAKDSLHWALKNSLKIYDNLEDSEDKFSTYSKAGIIYKKTGEYDKAIKYLLLAYDGFSKKNNISRKAAASGNIADVQRILGNLDISEIYYREHLALSKKLSDSLKLSFAYNNLANLFYEEKKYDSALVYYKDALAIQKQLNNTKNIGKTFSNIGMTYYELKEFKKAKEYYQNALVVKEKARDTISIVQTLNELALISIKDGKNDLAKNYLKNAERYIHSTTNAYIVLRNHHVKSEYFKSIGDFKKAYTNQNLEFSLYKDIFSEEQVKTIQTLQEQFESRLKEEKILDLTLKNENKNSIISVQKQTLKTKNLLLILFGLLILIFIGIYFFIKQQQKVKFQALENKKLEEVLAGQELVKNHISKDLHDIITTSYDGIRLKILALTKATNPKAIQKTIIEDIKTINHEIRLISHRLSPLGDKIKQASLNEIIISQLSEFQHYRQIFVDIQLPLPEVLNLMTLEAQTNFYGIVLEALNNIEKHSKATEISIKHNNIENNKKLSFNICDNGIGLVDKQNKGIGLINIEQRTSLLGGNYAITNTENGTCVSINFPIKQNLK